MERQLLGIVPQSIFTKPILALIVGPMLCYF
jgi:hypothetical protein